jgi:hypothetical protein
MGDDDDDSGEEITERIWGAGKCYKADKRCLYVTNSKEQSPS